LIVLAKGDPSQTVSIGLYLSKTLYFRNQHSVRSTK